MFQTLYAGTLASLQRAALMLVLGLILPLGTGCSGEVEQALDDGRTQVDKAVDESRTSSTDDASTQQAGVVSITDGDTIEVNRKLASGNSDVRFLAVDTPETTGGESQPLGEEAKRFTANQLAVVCC